MSHRTFQLKEVAEYLRLPRADVERLVREGEIPFEKQGDRVVFRKRDIDAWASRRILGFSKPHLKEYHRRTSAKHHDLSQRHAIIPELIRADYIEPALTSKTRASVVRDMAALAGRTGLVADEADLVRSLEERERMGPTALAGGIALLHPRHHEPYMFDDSFIVLGRTLQPVPFGSPDGETTDLFFLVCCQDDRIHLHVLARLAVMCHYTSVVLDLREATDAAVMFKALVESENEVIRQL